MLKLSLEGGFTASGLLYGAMDGQVFRTTCRRARTHVPTCLTVVLDDLAAHKVSSVRERFETAGARHLYLLANSSDFNPIELAFAKLKALLC